TVRELARRGLRMAVCSNKRVEFTRMLAEALGLAPYFAAVLGPEDVGDRPKPDPAMLWEVLRRLGGAAAEAVYVGGRGGEGYRAVGLVRGGAGGHESATTAGPDRVLTGFTELLALLPAVKPEAESG